MDNQYVKKQFKKLIILLTILSAALLVLDVFNIKSYLVYAYMLVLFSVYFVSIWNLMKNRGNEKNYTHEFTIFIVQLCSQIWWYMIAFSILPIELKIYYPFIITWLISGLVTEISPDRNYRVQQGCLGAYLIIYSIAELFGDYKYMIMSATWILAVILLRDGYIKFNQWKKLLKKDKQ